jgi:hypothetical protein
MKYEGIVGHVAEFEMLPGAPTPLWTRLAIETENGEMWVAACNFIPEFKVLEDGPDGTYAVLAHQGHAYIQLERAMAASGAARIVGEGIKASLLIAPCIWRKKRPSVDPQFAPEFGGRPHR